MTKFWNWTKQTDKADQTVRTLFLNGTIADESWYDDDVTPQLFKDDLYSDTGDVTVWLNSPGGDCVAAAQIYNMLREYPGNVTIKIDGIAASAASLIAMAGDTVLMSPVSMMMIHNPLTMAIGDADDMQKTIEMLNEVKDSIINAYELKTGMSRAKLSHLMDNETWMNAMKAVELGFADGILYRDAEKDDDEDEEPVIPDTETEETSEDPDEDAEQEEENTDEEKKPKDASKPMMFSRREINLDLIAKINRHFENKPEPAKAPAKNHEPAGRSVDMLMDRLNLLKY